MQGGLPLMIPSVVIREHVREWLREDMPHSDIAGSILRGKQAKAQLLGKSGGVLAGRPFVDAIFQELGCRVSWNLKEGQAFEPVAVIAVVEGDAQDVMLGERTALNLLARASGIATKCRQIVAECSRAGYGGRVAGTRKTTPGFRLVEKYAMQVGGCDPHRHDLSSTVMLKDNHIDVAGSITAAVRQAKALASFTQKLEVECRTCEDAEEALAAGADIVMIDNQGPARSGAWAAHLKARYPRAIVEVSGGVTAANIQAFASCSPHIDVISMGTLTQDLQHVDYSLKIVK